MSKIIEVPVSEAQEGDIFTGTLEEAIHQSGKVATINVSGPLVKSMYSLAVYVTPYLPYAFDTRWTNVTVTREVPDPTPLEQFQALKKGDRFRIVTPYEKNGETRIKISDTEWVNTLDHLIYDVGLLVPSDRIEKL